jgi:hypothetical protein
MAKWNNRIKKKKATSALGGENKALNRQGKEPTQHDTTFKRVQQNLQRTIKENISIGSAQMQAG